MRIQYAIDPKKKMPKLFIFDIPSNMSRDDENLQNLEGLDNLYIIELNIKPLIKIGLKGNAYTNSVLEAEPKAYWALKRQRRVFFDSYRCKCEELRNISRCFKWQKYGHVQSIARINLHVRSAWNSMKRKWVTNPWAGFIITAKWQNKKTWGIRLGVKNAQRIGKLRH